MEYFEFARVNWSGNILLVNVNSCIVRRKEEEFIVMTFQFCFLRKLQWISEGHFVLVIMWMYDVLLQVCLAIAHYSHPADPQLLFGFEYVGKRYHGSTGRKILMWPWQQIICAVSTRAAQLSWAIHTFSFPASQDMRRLSRECKVLMLWIAGPYNNIYMAAIIGLHCNM